MTTKAVLALAVGSLSLLVTSCSSGSNTMSTATPPVYVLSVTSVAGLHETVTSVSPASLEGVTAGTTNLSLSYVPGAKVTITAAAADANNANAKFLGWCDASSASSSPFVCTAPACTSSSGLTCTVTMDKNINLLATYPGVTYVTISPMGAVVSSTRTTAFTATVNGLGTYTDSTGTHNYQGSGVSFSVLGPANYMGSAGSIAPDPNNPNGGIYTPPSPAPPSATIKASSTISLSAYGATQITFQ